MDCSWCTTGEKMSGHKGSFSHVRSFNIPEATGLPGPAVATGDIAVSSSDSLPLRNFHPR